MSSSGRGGANRIRGFEDKKRPSGHMRREPGPMLNLLRAVPEIFGTAIKVGEIQDIRPAIVHRGATRPFEVMATKRLAGLVQVDAYDELLLDAGKQPKEVVQGYLLEHPAGGERPRRVLLPQVAQLGNILPDPTHTAPLSTDMRDRPIPIETIGYSDQLALQDGGKLCVAQAISVVWDTFNAGVGKSIHTDVVAMTKVALEELTGHVWSR